MIHLISFSQYENNNLNVFCAGCLKYVEDTEMEFFVDENHIFVPYVDTLLIFRCLSNK